MMLIIFCITGANTSMWCLSRLVGIGSNLHDLGAADKINFLVASRVIGINSQRITVVSISDLR